MNIFRTMYERIYYQNCRLRILSGVKSENVLRKPCRSI